MKLWLDIRKHANDEDLQYMGNVETIISYFKDFDSTEIMDLTLKELARQRQELAKIVKGYLGPRIIHQRSQKVLDAMAWWDFDALKNRGVQIKAELHPHKCASVYHSFGRLTPSVADKLYAARFHDIHASDYEIGYKIIPPVIFNAIHPFGREVEVSLSTSEWFISKGVSLDETWPDSTMAAWMILAYQVGFYVCEILNYASPYSRVSNKKLERYILALSIAPKADRCNCSCSASGCSPLSTITRGAVEYFEKHLRYRDWCFYEDYRPEMSRRLLIFLVTAWVAPAIRYQKSLSPIIFRSLSFWQLGLQHTCCNVSSLLMSRFIPTGESRIIANLKEVARLFATPLCSSERLDEIQEQDEYLQKELDILVAECYVAYQESNLDIVEFVMSVWSEKMRRLLQKLTEEDQERYCHGRTILGIKQDSIDLSSTGLFGEIDMRTKVRVGSRMVPVSEFLPVTHTLEGLDLAFTYDAAHGDSKKEDSETGVDTALFDESEDDDYESVWEGIDPSQGLGIVGSLL